MDATALNITEKIEFLKKSDTKNLAVQYISTGDNLPPGWFSGGDIQTYRTLFEAVPENGCVLEIGCFLGKSITSVADIIIKKNLKVFALDCFNLECWPEYKEIGVKSHYNIFLQTLELYKIRKHVCAIAHSSLDAHIFFADNQFDLIFSDSDHNYNHVVKELSLFKPKLKSNGTYAGHDVDMKGVADSVTEMFGKDYACRSNPHTSIWIYKPTSLSF